MPGNPEPLEAKPVVTLAQGAEIVRLEALYALVMNLGIVVFDGTTSAEHMCEHLYGKRTVKKWAEKNEEAWKVIRVEF